MIGLITRKSAVLIASALLWLGQQHAECFSQTKNSQFARPTMTRLASSQLNVEEQDWRAFRAKLVLQEEVEERHGSIDESEDGWAYESGTVIEQGSVILNRPPSKPYKFFGFALGRQYLHKSVMLVLQHHPHEYTTGVILNRPTDLVLEDSTLTAQIWYGGPKNGIHSPDPKFYCLHNLQSAAAQEASRKVIEGVSFTTIAQARSLVESGDATADDFWVFCGFTEMESEMLTAEVEEGLWHSVATSAKTLRNGFRILNAGAGLDPRDAGLSTWSMLMKMIQRNSESGDNDDEFDDLMLCEWATKYLVNFDDLMQHKEVACAAKSNKDMSEKETTTSRFEMNEKVVMEPGTLVRGSSAPRSPFLLENQEFHKSMLLMIQDDEHFSVGVLLNHPTPQHVDLQMLNAASSFLETELTYSVPLRYGGPADITGAEEAPLFFLHNSATLRKANIGEPVGSLNNIWRCSSDDAAEAIAKQLATPQDFMVINGFCVWDQQQEGGMAEQVREGNFELVPPGQSDQIWDVLLRQQELSRETIESNFEASMAAWSLSGKPVENHEYHPCVFKSNVKVSELSDTAFKVWLAAFFLDDPTLRP